MLQISRADVIQGPFPHIVKEGILPADLFSELRAAFPTGRDFTDQHAITGAVGSRTGSDTGFDIYRGDDAYDALIERSPAWAKLDAYINSPAFVDTFMAAFGPDLDALGCTISVDPAAYDVDYIEPRSVLTAKPTVGERLAAFLPRRHAKGEARKLFSRLDVEKSTKGYAKPAHCDRENRLCSLIIYFTDMAAEGIEGGELNIYRHRSKTDPVKHERHPAPDNVEVVQTITPKQNLGVFFPCSNNSYHGVNAVRTPGRERDFLYINISTVGAGCW